MYIQNVSLVENMWKILTYFLMRIYINSLFFYSEKVLCVGMNYVDHCTEQNLPIPVEPVIFK